MARSISRVYLDIETLPVAADDTAWVEYVDTVPAVVAAREKLDALRSSPIVGDKRLTDPAKVATDLHARGLQRADDIAAAECAVVEAREAARLATSLDPRWGRVACVGVRADADVSVLHGEDFGTLDGEREVLTQTVGALRWAAPWLLYGWNVQGFDLPFLRARAIITGCDALRDALPSPLAKPWEQPVRDLMLLWPTTSHGGRSFASQSSVARALGLPRQTFSGADVAGAYERGDYASIIEHCRADVAELVTIAERMGV